MYSNTRTGRASKGEVQVIESHGRLQLRFRYAGKRHYLSIGLPDTPVNRKVADQKARQIELDIVSGNFDETLTKYKPQSAMSVETPEITPKITPGLKELWEPFIEYKRPQCSENTMKYMYGVFTGYVERLPTYDLSRASEIRDWVVKNLPLDSGKRFITRLANCCRWGMQTGLIDANPFDGMAAEIKLPKSEQNDGLNDINPFTPEERERIIEAIAANQFCPKSSAFKHSHYSAFIRFLFTTGCRPSEAVALQWKHISNDFRQISFEQALIRTDSGKKIRKGLKTQERRKFPCNDSLVQLLKNIKPDGCSPDTLIFAGPRGKHIDTNNFRGRVWEPVLNGLGIEYRKLYQTRHTFITLALETGKLDAKDVARLVGNSPEIIYRHYAGNKRELFVPEF